MKFDVPIEIHDLLSSVRAKQERGKPYCVYGSGDSTNASLDTICYLSLYPEISDDYEENYSDFVSANRLELWYRDELVQDVVENALHQLPEISDARLLEAIKYYVDRDCFIELP